MTDEKAYDKPCMDCGMPITTERAYQVWIDRETGEEKGPLHFGKRDCMDALQTEIVRLLDQCEQHVVERNKLSDALQTIALLGDTGSDLFRREFPCVPVGGWIVAEKMQDIALSVVGLAECETCQDEGQVQLTDEGGNRAWWPCPACRKPRTT